MTPAAFARHRQALGWTQERAARELAVSLSSIKSWEIGRRPINPTAARLLLILAEWAVRHPHEPPPAP